MIKYFRQQPLRDQTNDFFKLPFEIQNISLGMILSNGKGSNLITFPI